MHTGLTDLISTRTESYRRQVGPATLTDILHERRKQSSNVPERTPCEIAAAAPTLGAALSLRVRELATSSEGRQVSPRGNEKPMAISPSSGNEPRNETPASRKKGRQSMAEIVETYTHALPPNIVRILEYHRRKGIARQEAFLNESLSPQGPESPPRGRRSSSTSDESPRSPDRRGRRVTAARRLPNNSGVQSAETTDWFIANGSRSCSPAWAESRSQDSPRMLRPSTAPMTQTTTKKSNQRKVDVPNDAREITVFFQPGFPPGLSFCKKIGTVQKIDTGGQAEALGIMVGMTIARVNGKVFDATDATPFLEARNGDAAYSVTFARSSKRSPRLTLSKSKSLVEAKLAEEAGKASLLTLRRHLEVKQKAQQQGRLKMAAANEMPSLKKKMSVSVQLGQQTKNKEVPGKFAQGGPPSNGPAFAPVRATLVEPPSVGITLVEPPSVLVEPPSVIVEPPSVSLQGILEPKRRTLAFEASTRRSLPNPFRKTKKRLIVPQRGGVEFVVPEFNLVKSKKGKSARFAKHGVPVPAAPNPKYYSSAGRSEDLLSDELEPVQVSVVAWTSQRDNGRHAAANLGRADPGIVWESSSPPEQVLVLDIGREREVCGLVLRCSGTKADPKDVILLRGLTLDGPWVIVRRIFINAGSKNRETRRHEFLFDSGGECRFWKMIIKENWGASGHVSIVAPLTFLVRALPKEDEPEDDLVILEAPNFKQQINLEVFFSEALTLSLEDQEVRSVARKHDIPLHDAERICDDFRRYASAGRTLDYEGFSKLLHAMVMRSAAGYPTNKFEDTVDMPENRVLQMWNEIEQEHGYIDFEDFLIWFYHMFHCSPLFAESQHSGRGASSLTERFYHGLGRGRIRKYLQKLEYMEGLAAEEQES